MIKVTIGGEPQKEKEITYPCLMKSKESKNIVLFTEHKKGFVIDATGGLYIGYLSECWDMSLFEKLKNPITLQNITE